MKKSKTVLVILALIMVSAVAFSAGTKEDQPKRVGVVELYNNPFWVDAERGIREIAEPLGIKLTVLNSNGDPLTQAQHVTNLISAQVDGAIIGPVAAAGAVADLTRLNEGDIDVVCGDSCAPDNVAPTLAIGWSTSSGADLGHGVGKAAADYIKA